ncbi:Hypothetical predicted protein [Pelobates cultripes]|uniref:Uncharacterized protein n=1 Tax=Pelobates cultripes TaxID=61616 RepID=A0AAD1S0L7_PELCU|nr:Hypothetical predicted protein [Pelobates cultripes]
MGQGCNGQALERDRESPNWWHPESVDMDVPNYRTTYFTTSTTGEGNLGCMAKGGHTDGPHLLSIPSLPTHKQPRLHPGHGPTGIRLPDSSELHEDGQHNQTPQ